MMAIEHENSEQGVIRHNKRFGFDDLKEEKHA